MKKIWLTGYYGQSNFGDDLFQELFKLYLERNFKNIIVNNYAPINKGRCSRLKRVLHMIKQIISNDIVIFAGGSILSSRGSTKMKKAQHTLVRLLNKKALAYGVSYGPFDDEKSKVFYHEFIKNLEFISLRDNNSYEEVLKINGINKNNVYYTGDIANLIPQVYGLEETDNKLVLGISLCNYDKYTKEDYLEEEKFLKSLIENISKNLKNYDQIVIFALKTGELGDEELAKYQYKIYSKVHENVKIVYHENEVVDTLQELNSVSHLIGMRLHAMIPSIILNKKTLAIEYHDKCKDFLDTINYPKELRISRKSYKNISFDEYLTNLKNTNTFNSTELNEYKNAHENANNKLKALFNEKGEI